MDKKELVLMMAKSHSNTMTKYAQEFMQFMIRIDKMYIWREANLLESGNQMNLGKIPFIGDKCLVNGIICLCTDVEIRATPQNIIRFEFRPFISTDDAGNGCGCAVEVKF